MKLAKLREIAQHKNTFSGGHSFLQVMQDHVDALLDVAEAAKSFSNSCCVDDRDLHRMLEVEDALKKLEAVE